MTQQNVLASSQVDGDKLAEAFRRLTPFMAGKGTRPGLEAVFVESHGGTLELTACDGYRLAHATLELDFPEGDYLLDGDGCKDFAWRHYGGGQILVEVYQSLVKLEALCPRAAEVRQVVQVDRLQIPYIDYRRLSGGTYDTWAIVETKRWIKPLRQHHAEVVGVVYSPEGCRLYFQNQEGDTIAVEEGPVQMFSGPERKVAYHGERLRRALTSCGPSVTIKVGDPKRATLFETEGYYHLLMATTGFPREVNFTAKEREVLTWAEDVLQSVRRGEVFARVEIGGGKLYLELSSERTATEIVVNTPEEA